MSELNSSSESEGEDNVNPVHSDDYASMMMKSYLDKEDRAKEE